MKRLPRIQFSLFGLLAAMAGFGVALACILKFGLSLPLVAILWGLLLFMFMVAPILAFVGMPQRRAFYAGFAWFGWMYILIYTLGFVTHHPISFNLNSTRSTSPVRFPQVFLERGIFAVYKWVVPPRSRMMSSEDPESQYLNLASQYDSQIWSPPINVPAAAAPMLGGGVGFAGSILPTTGGVGSPPPTAIAPPPAVAYRYIPWEIFRDLAHALLAVLWAILGGCLVAWIARRNAQRKLESVTPTPR
jgi:hypothetical protein